MSETTTPSAMVPVRLIGGPADWHETTLAIHTAAELAGPRKSLGTYLISNHVPVGHPDPGARAVYEPDAEPADPRMWFFRGWFPYGPDDPEHRRADHHVPVDVDIDGQLPAGWVTDDGGRYRVDRILAHWQTSGEDQLAPDVWHVRAGASDWELFQFPGDLWQAGPLPAADDGQ